MKSKTNKMWHRICECNSIGDLQPQYWNMLREVALNMCKTDFSKYNKEDILNPLTDALLYQDWKDLRELSKLELDLNFLVDCYVLASKKYNGKIDRLFKSKEQEDRNELGIAFTEESITTKFRRTRKNLGIEYKLKEPRDNDKIYLDDIAYYNPDDSEDSPSLTEIYYSLKNHIDATKRIKAMGLRRRKK